MPQQDICPVCKHKKHDLLYPECEGPTISSDLKVLNNSTLDNRLCRHCGLIFNAKGVRGFSDEFYRDSYSLMLLKKEAEIKSFSSEGTVSQAQKSFELFLEMSGVSPGTPLLEVGAGKGDFLEYLLKEYSTWPVDAFEPSESFYVLDKKLPSVEAVHCAYKNFPLEPESYDSIVSLGVLEHVENPLDMLRWMRTALKSNGICFIRVPLFENNPNDLFTVDHLSKLTMPTLKYLVRLAGFELIDSKILGVAVFLVLRKLEKPETDLHGVYEENKDIALTNCQFARGAIDAVRNARQAALADSTGFGVFGLAISGLFAPFLLGFPTEEITAYIDENTSMWGTEVHGRPVGGLDLISELNIGHIALVISPVYHQKVKEKLDSIGVSVYTPLLIEG